MFSLILFFLQFDDSLHMVDVIKPICYISMPAHLPQVASYSSSQTQDVCILLRRLGDVICEARDAADDYVQVVGPLWPWTSTSGLIGLIGSS